MSETLTLNLPFPPSLNRYRCAVNIGGKPRIISTKKGNQYKDEVKTEVLQYQPKKLEGRLAVRINFHYSTKRAYDLDNFMKALLDALTEAGVWADDSQIDFLTACRGSLVNPRRVVVHISEIAKDQDLESYQ